MVLTAKRPSRTRHADRRPVAARAPLGTPEPTFRDEVWAAKDFVRMLCLVGLGAIGLGACYVGARNADRWSEQLAWLAGGIFACAVGALGMVGWLLAGFRVVRAEIRVATAWVQAQGVRIETQGGGLPPSDGSPVIGPGMHHFHRPQCPLVKSKAVHAVPAGDLLSEALAPCGVCRP